MEEQHPAVADTENRPTPLRLAKQESESEATPSITPEEEKQLTAELRKQELIERLEEEGQESLFGQLARSKTFWYAIFGTIFFVIMGGILYWTGKDLGLF